MENNKTTTQGTGLSTIVFLIFLILKLTGVGAIATWSWWWVCSPLWIPLFLVFCVLGIIGVYIIVRDIFKYLF